MVSQRALCAAMAGAAILVGSNVARAADPAWMHVFVSPGAVFSWSKSPDTGSGAGFEISAGYVAFDYKGFWMPTVGGVYRIQNYDTGTYGSYGRHTIGIEGTVAIFGLEVGYGYRDAFGAQGQFKSGSGLHLSPFLTLGLLYAGPQFLFPVDGKPEVAFNFGLKLPLPHAIVLPVMAFAMRGD